MITYIYTIEYKYKYVFQNIVYKKYFRILPIIMITKKAIHFREVFIPELIL